MFDQRHSNLPRLHYVTQGETTAEHLTHLKRLCEAGCPWIQLRLKGVREQEYQAAAREAVAYCKTYKVLLTINDSVATAKMVGADGVHVGKTDQAPAAVRAAYPSAIIGATANTWEDVAGLANAPIDYIGLGPLRFTSTKKNLSPVLGLEGYELILQKMKEQQINIPVLAIGGIREEDVASLRALGVWGIAVSGLLTQSNEPQQLVQCLLK